MYRVNPCPPPALLPSWSPAHLGVEAAEAEAAVLHPKWKLHVEDDKAKILEGLWVLDDDGTPCQTCIGLSSCYFRVLCHSPLDLVKIKYT